MNFKKLGYEFERRRRIFMLRCRWLKLRMSKFQNGMRLKFLDLIIWYQARRERTLEQKYLVADSKAFQQDREDDDD